MVFKKYYINIYIRVFLIMATCMLAGWMITTGSHPLITIHIFLLLVIQAFLLVRYTNRWNNELSDFFSRLLADDHMSASSTLSHFPKLREMDVKLKALSEKIRQDKIKHQIENEYFRILSQNVATGIVVCDDKGDVQFVNFSALYYFGLQSIRNLQYLERHHKGVTGFLEGLKAGDYGSLNIEVKGLRQLLMFRTSEIVVENQRLKVYSIEDIEKEIKKHELESWQKLIRILNHEIMNSISPITSTVGTLADSWKGVKSSEEAEQQLIRKTLKGLEIIHERSDGLRNFVEAYRSLTKMPEPSIQKLDPAILFDSVEALFKEVMLENQVNLKIVHDSCKKGLNTDPGLLQQILINLVKNALESFDTDKAGKKIELLCEMIGDTIFIKVSDNGCGMDEATLKNATIPFFTTKTEGTGVGLSLVRQLVSALDGEMHLVSKSGEGTRVEMRFPVVQ